MSRPQTELTRARHKESTNRAELDALLDAVHIAHVGLVADGHPVVLPTACARDGDRLLIHGSTGAGWLRRLTDGADACITVTAFDGLVVARSAFESSMHYRSAVLFGRLAPVTDPEQALHVLTDALIPGRTSEIRRPSAKELAATTVLALPIERWSLKLSAKWPEDGDEDVAGDAWAGVLPISSRYGAPLPAPDLRAGIEVPPSISALSDRVR